MTDAKPIAAKPLQAGDDAAIRPVPEGTDGAIDGVLKRPVSQASTDMAAAGPETTTSTPPELFALSARLRSAVRKALPAFGLVAVFLPGLLGGILCADIAVRWFDGLVANPSVHPSLWLTGVDVGLTLNIWFILVLARERGLGAVLSGYNLACLVTIVVLAAIFVDIAPTLVPGDLPSTRYTIGTLVTWLLATLSACAFYAILKGSKPWWRAPLTSLVVASAICAVLQPLLLYAGTDVPWLSWMGVDLILRLLVSTIALWAYRASMNRRPRMREPNVLTRRDPH